MITEKQECDRCGVKLNHEPSALSLLRPRPTDVPLLLHTEYYNFRLCKSCTRALFAWVGNTGEDRKL